MIAVVFILLMIAPEQGRVVINTGVPGAEFYLDANFVATTDEKGMLTMDNFPAGSFNFSIKKKGYKDYVGSFVEREGEVKQLQPVLVRIRASEGTEERASHSLQSSRPPRSRSPSPEKQPIASLEPQRAPAQKYPPVNSPNPQPPTQALPEESSGSSFPVPAILFIIVLAGIVVWYLVSKRSAEPILPPEEVAEAIKQEPPANVSNRPAPQFIEELRHKEELLKAGFVGSKVPHVDQEAMREKEVVIVLPKEAFRYDEDK